MRTGEIMSLRRDEVDVEKKTAHICRIVVEKQAVERTKTKYTRTVKLNSRAFGALARPERSRNTARSRSAASRRSRHSSSSLLARHHESSVHRWAAWALGAGASLDLRQVVEFCQRLDGTGEAGKERNGYRIKYRSLCAL